MIFMVPGFQTRMAVQTIARVIPVSSEWSDIAAIGLTRALLKIMRPDRKLVPPGNN